MPVAEAIPITFSERLLALFERVARNWIETRFSALIPLPEIDNDVVASHTVNHRRNPRNCEARLRQKVTQVTDPWLRFFDVRDWS